MERLGSLIRRDTKIQVPDAVDASPIALRDWEAAVGTRIAERARPIKLERGVLHVKAASSTWAQELALLGDAIAAQLRTRGFAVQSLRFRVGAVDRLERPPWRDEVRAEPPEATLPPEVSDQLARVADPALRAAIAKAAAKNLGWQAAETATAARRAARGPRSAASGSVRQGQTRTPAGGDRRGRSGGAGGRGS